MDEEGFVRKLGSGLIFGNELAEEWKESLGGDVAGGVVIRLGIVPRLVSVSLLIKRRWHMLPFEARCNCNLDNTGLSS